MKKIIVVLTFLISGLAFAQTTVTLEDQCNCEVLSGPDVTTPGMTTPAGADTGDIYVNTNTGTIYFWDGDSWELTSSDDQQILDFSYDAVTRGLTLELENGGAPITVTLPAETVTTITGAAAVGNAIGVYENENGDLVTINETITSIVDNNDGNVTLINEAGASVTISKSDITDNGDGTYTFTNNDGTDVTINTNGIAISNVVVGNRIATVTDASGAFTDINETITSIVDNNDGSVTFNNEAGGTTTVSKSDITDNGDGTYTFTNNDGTDVTVNTNGIAISNVVVGNRIATVTDASGAFTDINETITSVVDNNDGSVTFNNEAGGTTTVSKSDITDNGDGTYTFTNNDGTDVTVNTNGIAISNVVVGNRIATVTDASGAFTDINETITSIVDNNDGSVTFNNEAGGTTTVSKSDITDNGDGTYTFTNNDGTDVTVNTNGIAISNVVVGNRIATVTDASGAFTDINETITSVVDNNDGSVTFNNEAGGTTTVSKSDITDNGDGTYTFTNNDGTDVTVNTNGIAISNVVVGNRIATVTDASGAFTDINETITSIVDNNDGSVTFNNEAGGTTTVSKSDITDNGDGTYTFTNNDGTDVTVNTNGIAISNVVAGNLIARVTDASGAITDIDETITSITGVSTTGNEIGVYNQEDSGTISIQETITSIVDNNDGRVTFNNEAGGTTTVSKSDIRDNGDGTYTFTNNDGTDVTVNTNGIAISNVVLGNRIATVTDASGAFTNINETITSIVDNSDGSVTFNNEGGGTTTVSKSDITDNGDGTYTFTNNDGTDVTIDNRDADFDLTNELTLVGTGAPIVTPSNIGVTYVDDAAGQLYVWDGAAWQVVGGNASPDLDPDPTNERNTGFAVNGANLEITDSGGTLSVPISSLGTDDQTAAEVSYDNTTSGLTATDTQAAIDELSSGSSDDQNIESLGVNTTTNVLTVGIEDGTSQTVDLSHLDDAGTDDQNATEVNYDNTTSGLTAGDTQAAIDELAAGSTDDQNIENLALNGATNVLTVGIEDGTSQTVDLSGLVGTDDQTAGEVSYDNTSSGLTATDTQAAIDELSADSSDDQNIESLGVNTTTNVLTVGIEDGTSQTVDLSHLDDSGTDAQNLSSAVITANESVEVQISNGTNTTIDIRDADSDVTNELSLLGTGAPTVTPSNAGVTYVDQTAGQLYVYNGAAWEAVGGNASPDLDGDPTNERNTAFTVSGGNLNITDSGGTLSVPVASLGTDDQTAAEVTYDNTTSGLTATDTQAAIDELTAGSTDNQNIESLAVDAGTNVLTVGIEDGTSQTVDLSHLDDAGTDDQIASEVNITDAGGNFTATEVEGALAELAAGSTDNQNIESLGVDAGTNVLTVGIEDGTSQTVDLSHLDDAGTDDQIASEVNIADAGGNFTATEVEGALAELAAGSTDNQNIESLGVDAGTNVLTVGIEDGTSQTVDLSHLDDAGTDDQIASEVNITDAGGNFTATEVEGALAELAAGSTDNQNIESLGVDAGTNVLTVGIEDGTSQTVDLSHLDDAGTDDQIASEVNYDNTTSGLTATDTQAAIDELSAGSTDDQNIESLGLNGATNVLTVGIEDGTSQTVDLSGLVGTDDQTAAEVSYDNTTSGLTATDTQAAIDELSAGSTDDQTVDGLSMNAGELNISLEDDGVAPVTVDMISSDANNNISAGTDGALYLNVASVTISETNTTLGFNGATNQLTYTNELGNNPVLDLSGLVGTDDQTAAEVTYDNTTSGLTATDTQAAIDELTAGSTDNQNIESLAVDAGTNVLTVGIEDGTSQTVDLSHLDDAGTDDQIASEVNITDAGGNFTATEVEGALAELAAGSTDNQNIESLGVDAGTNVLTVGIEDGTSQTVDLSHLDDAGTDDQIASEVNITDAGGNFTATEVEGALAELAAGSTDNQNIESLGVDAGTNVLTVGIEDGTSQTVDLSHLDDAGTDDQIASEVNYDNTTSGLTATDTQAAIDELSAGSTDDQNIESLGVDAGTNVLTVGIENGTSQTVDLSHLDDAGTDNQNIESLGVNTTTNVLTVGIEDGTSQTVDLSHLDDAGTDDQTAAEVSYDNTTSGLTATDTQAAIDELSAGSTDNQNIENLALNGATNVLTVGIEDGTSQTIDLSGLVGTDDQIASEVNITDAGGNFTATEVEGALAELAAGSTDNQNIESLGVNTTSNVLTVGIEDGTSQTVDLSHLDDAGTDNQNIESLAVDAGTNVLTVGIEDGTSQTVDLSHLDDAGTDDQIASEVNITDAGGNFTATEVEGALAELAAGSTDNQNIESLGVNTTTNVLTVGIEDGTSQTVDLSHLDDSGTDSQTLSTDGTAGDITISGGNNITLNVDDADAIIGNEVVNGTDATLTRSGAGTTVSPYTLDVSADGITNAEIADDAVQLENIANGTADGQVMQWDGTTSSWTLVDLGSVTVTENDGVIGNEVVNGTDGTLTRSGAGTTVSPYTLDVAADGITNAEIANDAVQLENIADGTSADQIMQWNGTNWILVDGAGLSTDNQNIESLGVDAGTNVLTVGIEDGTSQTVDLSHLDDAGTDNQNIESLGVDAGTNVLTVGIEDGTSQTVDLSHLDDAGTDDQIASEVNITDAGGNFTATEVEGALAELAAGSTDNQNIESLGVDAGTNVLTVGIEDGTSQTVDLSHLDDAGTDDQIASEVNITDAGGNFTATEVEGALAELAAGSTDNQNIESLGVDAGTNVLTVGIEDGTSQTVDLSHLDDAGTDNQNIESLALDGATNVLTVGIEDGTSQTVDLSGLEGTDNQNIESLGVNTTTNVLTVGIEDGTSDTVDLSHLDDSGTDNQNIESLGVDAGTNVLTVGIEDGTSQTVDLSHLDDAGTDDQIASEVNITDAGGNFTATEVEGALAELAAGSTDNQNIESLGVDAGTNVLTVGIEDGTSQTVDLSHLDDAGTDNQNIESLALDGATNVLTVGIEDGTSQTVDLSGLEGTDNQNIESLGVNTTTNVLTVGIEDGTSDTVDLSHLDDSGTDNQNIESLGVDAGTNVLTVGIEDGTSQTVDLSHLDDAGTDDQIASEVNITDAGGNFTATEVEGALAELAAGSTDNQNIESLGVDAGTNVLTVGIEDGTSQTVDLSHLDDAGTDNQNIESLALDGATNVLTVGIEDGTSQTVDLSGLEGTDNQNIESLGVNTTTNVLTVGIEDGTSDTVDLSHLDDSGTDNQNIESLGVDAGTNVLTVGIEDGTSQTVDLSHLDDAGTDNQNIESLALDGATNVLTVGIEDGTSQTVDLSGLEGTDNQNIESLGVNTTTNVLTVGIEDGTSDTVDLSHLDDSGTDNQNIESLGVDAGTNVLTVGIEDGTSQTVDLSHLDDAGTDNQNIESLGLAGTTLTVGIEDGTAQTVNLSGLVGTDNQNIESLGVNTTTNVLTVGIEDGTSDTVDLSHLDDSGTDNQNIESLAVDAGTNVLTVGIEDGTSDTVDLSHLDDSGTDNQNIESLGLAGTTLTVGIEDGTAQTVNLSGLVGTDNQNIESLGVNTTTNVLTVGIEDGTSDTVDLSHLDDSGTDNQNIESLGLAGTTLTVGIEDGTAQTVNLSGLVGTDNQNIESLGVNTTTNVLTVGIEDGTSDTVDLSHLDNAGTDNQNIESLAVNTSTNVLTVGIEDGTSDTVDLSHLDDSGTDNQNIESLAVNTTTNVLTVGIEDGTSDTVDLSHLDDSGTDDQFDDEVDLRVDIDVDEGGIGSPTLETTVQEVIQAIAPITSKAARIFYPPSIAVDASTTGIKSIDLYQEYLDQFGTPTAGSAGAPAAVPTYGRTELYYYVTYADPTVFETDAPDPNFMTIDANGNLTIEVENIPTDYNTLINVVFVVK